MTREQRYRHHAGDMLALTANFTQPVPAGPILRAPYRYLNADGCDSVELSAEGRLKSLAAEVAETLACILEFGTDGISPVTLLEQLKERAEKEI